jgi:glycosyltransferase involved in cell wall biosynthesis
VLQCSQYSLFPCDVHVLQGRSQEQQTQQKAKHASKRDFQTVVMGSGDKHLENELRYLSRTLPGRAAGLVGFDERLAHRMLAAADILVVPSRFEPCGLVALSALRYGAVPVVASTGGLRDIVTGRFLLDSSSSLVRLLQAPAGSSYRFSSRRSACFVYI